MGVDEDVDETAVPAYVKRSRIKNQRRLLQLQKASLHLHGKRVPRRAPSAPRQRPERLPVAPQQQDTSTAIYLLMLLSISMFAIFLNSTGDQYNVMGYSVGHRSLSREREHGELVEILFSSTSLNSSSVNNATGLDLAATKFLRLNEAIEVEHAQNDTHKGASRIKGRRGKGAPRDPIAIQDVKTKRVAGMEQNSTRSKSVATTK
mmetsp:Transcript_35818/g.74508  ORF Transcript_35818/g.74508 Transcript_35818/m.74508 type:complete len:205 (+) Transcript_35818:47-661(+)